MRKIEEVNKEYNEAIVSLGKHYYDESVLIPQKIKDLQEKIASLYKEAAQIENENKSG